ncbi:unnamed protein product, partial [Iphiclides podalirius]
MKNNMKTLVILATIALVRAEFICPSKSGQYPDDKQCDRFWDCKAGKAADNFCPDGLVYNPTQTRSIHKCDYPFDVECGNRTLLQSPQPSAKCPRRNGLFAHPDPTFCDIYYDCVDGVAKEIKCTDGAQLDEQPPVCKWSYLLAKEACKVSTHSFVCPKVKQGDQTIMHPVYPHLSDCQKFYVCFNGFEPRELSCPFGEVYNDAKEKCDSPVNVPGCEDWYAKPEEFEDTTEDVQFE